MAESSVLLTTYPEAYLHKGGGEYELIEIGLNLRKLGIVTDVYGSYSRDIERYDTVIHFSIVSSGLSLLRSIRSLKKKIILWPNFWTGNCVNAHILANAQAFLECADAVVFKSQIELENFSRIATLESINTLLIPAGVDPCFADPTPERLFRESFGVEDYILWVGILEPHKNQLGVIKALHNLEVPLIFIGNYRDAAYYEACRTAAPEHFIFLEPMEHASDLLRAAIRESRLYIEPTLEPAGKSILEAAICGTIVLVSDAPWEREHLSNFAIYVDPQNSESLQAGIRRGLNMARDADQVRILSQKYLLPEVLAPLAGFVRKRP